MMALADIEEDKRSWEKAWGPAVFASVSMATFQLLMRFQTQQRFVESTLGGSPVLLWSGTYVIPDKNVVEDEVIVFRGFPAGMDPYKRVVCDQCGSTTDELS